MKKFFLLVLVLFFSFVSALASNDYDALYESAQPFESKLYHDIDPFQDEDNIRYSWSPYPLFRTSADLYFKDYKVEAGYYLLTPRTLKNKDYVLFKQNGKVMYIIPVVKKEKTPVNFYEANTPPVKKTLWQKASGKVREKFYNVAKDSGRKTPPKSMINVSVEVKYVIISFYYGEDKYVLLFKRSPY